MIEQQAHAFSLTNLGRPWFGLVEIAIEVIHPPPRALKGRIIHRETGETFHKVFNPPADYKEVKKTITNVKMTNQKQ